MSIEPLADFYHGWLIEVSQITLSPIEQLDQSIETGFEMVCYSPCRQKIRDRQIYLSQSEAMRAAKQMIDWQGACQSLSGWLRQLYETDQLNFEEWRSLHQSITAVNGVL